MPNKDIILRFTLSIGQTARLYPHQTVKTLTFKPGGDEPRIGVGTAESVKVGDYLYSLSLDAYNRITGIEECKCGSELGWDGNDGK